MGNSEINKIMKLALLSGLEKNKKKTNKSKSTTPFLNRGLRRVFFDSDGFFIIIPKNGKAKKQYVSGTFAFKNIGYRIVPWRPIR